MKLSTGLLRPASRLLRERSKQLGDRHLKRRRQLAYVDQTHISFATLDTTHVVTVEVGPFRQGLPATLRIAFDEPSAPARLLDMSDWVRRKAEEVRGRERTQREEAEIELRKAKVVEGKASETLEAIMRFVGRDVKAYQEEFGNDTSKRTDFNVKPSGGFTLDKPVYPSASMECSLDIPGHAIVATYAFTEYDSAPVRQQEKRIELRADIAGNIELHDPNRTPAAARSVTHRRGVKYFSNLEEAAQFLIEPLLFSA